MQKSFQWEIKLQDGKPSQIRSTKNGLIEQVQVSDEKTSLVQDILIKMEKSYRQGDKKSRKQSKR